MGHINILERAAALGNHLTVGVSTDALNYDKKQRYPIYEQSARVKIISSLQFVDAVFLEHSLDMKAEYLRQHQADILVMGDDWQGKFDCFKDICEVIYLPRTPSISTTEIIEVVHSLSK